MREFFEYKNKYIIKGVFFFLGCLITTLLLSLFFSRYNSPVNAANVLSNPSFTGGTTGWSLTNMSYDSTNYQDSAGSVYASAGRKASTSATAVHTSYTSISSDDTITLSGYWAHTTTGNGSSTLYIEVEEESNPGTWTQLWTSGSQTTSGTWALIDNIDVSSSFSTGSYRIRLRGELSGGASPNSLEEIWFDNMNLDVVSPDPIITVGTTGTQTSSVQASTSDFYVGGAFTFVRDSDSTSVTSITVSETGTIADANLSGLILYYKQEATCSTSIPVDATQFNSTAGTFSSGSSTVTGSMTVGTSQVCVYAEVDIGSASNGDTLEIEITDPSTDVTASAGVVSPNTAVAISGTTTVEVNVAPGFTDFSNDGPKDPGTDITFTATSTDSNGDNVMLVVCKTQGVTGTACDGGAGDTWCSSSLVASNPSCAYSIPTPTLDTTYDVYPYVFDANDLGSDSALQGALDTYTVSNVAPVVSNVTINAGSAIDLVAGSTKSIDITGTVTDNNSCNDLDSVLGYAYRSGVGYIGQEINTYYFNDTTPTDPNLVWSSTSNAFDGNTGTSASTTTAGSTSSNYLEGNGTNAPSTGSTISQVRARIFANSGESIDANVYASISYNSETLGEAYHSGTSFEDGLEDYSTLNAPTGGWTWTALQGLDVRLYSTNASTSPLTISGPKRIEIEVTSSSGTGCSSSTDADNNNCYPDITCTLDTGTCTGDTDASATYTCTANLQYYADPTDTATQYSTEFWKSTIKATDDDTASGYTEVSAGVKLNSLSAFNISTEVNYGALGIDQGNDPLDRTTLITPTGNVGLDHELSGPTYMCTDFPTCSGSTIDVGYQKYALTSSTAYSSATALTTTATEVETNVPKPITGSPTGKSIWWGIYIPSGTANGSYDGTITVTGLKGEIVDW